MIKLHKSNMEVYVMNKIFKEFLENTGICLKKFYFL